MKFQAIWCSKVQSIFISSKVKLLTNKLDVVSKDFSLFWFFFSKNCTFSISLHFLFAWQFRNIKFNEYKVEYCIQQTTFYTKKCFNNVGLCGKLYPGASLMTNLSLFLHSYRTSVDKKGNDFNMWHAIKR